MYICKTNKEALAKAIYKKKKRIKIRYIEEKMSTMSLNVFIQNVNAIDTETTTSSPTAQHYYRRHIQGNFKPI